MTRDFAMVRALAFEIGIEFDRLDCSSALFICGRGISEPVIHIELAFTSLVGLRWVRLGLVFGLGFVTCRPWISRRKSPCDEDLLRPPPPQIRVRVRVGGMLVKLKGRDLD